MRLIYEEKLAISDSSHQADVNVAVYLFTSRVNDDTKKLVLSKK